MSLLALETAALCRRKHSPSNDPKPRSGMTSSSVKDRLEWGHRVWARWDLGTRQRQRSAVGSENLLARKGFRAKTAKDDEGSDDGEIAGACLWSSGVFAGHLEGMT